MTHSDHCISDIIIEKTKLDGDVAGSLLAESTNGHIQVCDDDSDTLQQHGDGALHREQASNAECEHVKNWNYEKY